MSVRFLRVRSAAGAMWAGLALVLLSACGGERGIEPTHVLQAQVSGCSSATAHDSSKVVYITMSRICESRPGVRSIALRMVSNPATARHQSVELTLAPGQEADSVAIPGLGVRRVGLFHAGQWRSIANEDSWQPRDGAGLLYFKGELYLLGGWLYGPTSSEVWKTSDLVHWQLLTFAPWPGRHGAAWLVHEDRLWVIGGDLYDDVWSSPDGVSWNLESEHAPFGGRYTPNAASVNGKIIVYAGQHWEPVPWCITRPDCTAVGRGDVWGSRDGRHWELLTSNAPWAGRGLIHGTATHAGRIYLIGGGLKVTPPGERYAETSAEFGDIWSSSDGAQWKRETDRFSFPLRTHFSVTSAPMGCFVSDGSIGMQATLSNDLFFASDCVDFAPVPEAPPLQRRHASSLAYFNGSLVILGGPGDDAPGTQVWQYFPGELMK